jgi:hypothetical protein
VTDEQRGRRPIFIATLWAGASWLFFRVARSTRMTKIWALRYRQSGSDRLEKQPTDLRQKACYFGDRTVVLRIFAQILSKAIAGRVANGYTPGRMANRNSKRRAKAELKSRRQSGQKLVNPESKRGGGRRGMGVRGRRSASMAA